MRGYDVINTGIVLLVVRLNGRCEALIYAFLNHRYQEWYSLYARLKVHYFYNCVRMRVYTPACVYAYVCICVRLKLCSDETDK